MTVGSQEHEEIMAMFEKEFRGGPMANLQSRRLDRERKEMWRSGHVYQNAEVNNLFLAYQCGYSFAKAVYRS